MLSHKNTHVAHCLANLKTGDLIHFITKEKRKRGALNFLPMLQD